MLEETGLDLDALLLEITESAVMEDTDLSEAMLRGLNGLGVRVAIDEFGTGYSSLAYLKRFDSAVAGASPFTLPTDGRVAKHRPRPASARRA